MVKQIDYHNSMTPIINTYKKELVLYNKTAASYREIIEFQQTLKNSQQKVEEATIERSIAQKQIDLLHFQAKTLDEKADAIASQKEQLYQLGIIPPDYRTLDACIMLNSIFNNDLADTMREAILLYDERVFRGEVLRGIDEIFQMLGRLAHSMKAIEDRLTSIKHSVDSIVEETRTISSQLYSIEKTTQNAFGELNESIQYAAQANEQYQAEILSQTQAARQSAEAIQHTGQKYEWYMEQHRQGLI